MTEPSSAPSAAAAGDVGSTSNFVELSEARCRELLATTTVGRVGWNAPDGPQVLPVNFAWDAGQIVFRTSPYGVLAQLVHRQRVAFQVDEIDEAARSGWSVQVRGTAEGLKQSARLLGLWQSDSVVPWASGTRPLFIAITPTTITGRAVRAWT